MQKQPHKQPRPKAAEVLCASSPRPAKRNLGALSNQPSCMLKTTLLRSQFVLNEEAGRKEDPNFDVAWWTPLKTPCVRVNTRAGNPWRAWGASARWYDKVFCEIIFPKPFICFLTSLDSSSEFDWRSVVPGRRTVHLMEWISLYQSGLFLEIQPLPGNPEGRRRWTSLGASVISHQSTLFLAYPQQ